MNPNRAVVCNLCLYPTRQRAELTNQIHCFIYSRLLNHTGHAVFGLFFGKKSISGYFCLSNRIHTGRTDKVEHHLWRVVWCGGDTQQLLSFSHRGVVDCLDVDVVTRHHDVTDLTVLLCICHLHNRFVICRINSLKQRFNLFSFSGEKYIFWSLQQKSNEQLV